MPDTHSTEMTGESLDIAEDNRARLKQLFPSVFSETVNDKGETVEALDFEKLKAELGTFTDLFESRRERYGMDWAGKRDCLRLIQSPTRATLQPCPDDGESVRFDTSENLYIEGDNLEVLKLLQKSYFGKVKMIYIDPPYNTGNDFIYPDDFSDSLGAYLELTGALDGKGRKLSTNTASEGRFHTNWLNMMYPRLYLARNLLREDGVIFVSIDDNEVTNLRKVCDEVFGEENFVTEFVWEKKKKPAFLHRNIGTLIEYIVCYVKASEASIPFSVEETENGKKTPINNAGNSYSRIVFPPRSVKINLHNQTVLPQDMSEGNIITRLIEEVQIKDGYNENHLILEGEWRYAQNTINDIIQSGDEIRISKIPFRPNHIKKGGEIKKMKNLLSPTHYGVNTYEDATATVRSLFDDKDIFDNPKPHQLIEILTKAVTYEDKDDIILDFFSGSATTAHAVLDLNKQDGGNRKFILVQLPEPCKPDSEAFKAGFKTIADIGKERIRRVIAKLYGADNSPDTSTLPGFKTFKLRPSFFKQWRKCSAETLAEELSILLREHADHIDPSASPLDLLCELLLKSGHPLNEKIDELTLAGTSVYSAANGSLLLCLEKSVTKELIEEAAALRPKKFICLDAAFHDNDQLKANAVQTFKALSTDDNGKSSKVQTVFRTV